MKRKSAQFDFAAFPLIVVLLIVLALGCIRPQADQVHDEAWAMLPFVKPDSVNQVLNAANHTFTCPVRNTVVAWDVKDVFNPAAVVREGKLHLLFRAEDTVGIHAGTSRLGLAISEDGFHFNVLPEPVFFPGMDSMNRYEWEGGVEDPRLVESEEGEYILTYTAYDGKLARLCLATSPDLLQWRKHGLVLGGKYRNTWSKSGAIVARQQGERMVATKINGKYWMYFGDTNLFLAQSEDLIHWLPLEENGQLKPVLQPRPAKFDSRLVESGPFALLKPEGIILLYNGMNLEHGGDPDLPPNAYCAGQALFDRDDPAHLIDRLDHYFLRPEQPYELTGQVNQVVFVEGLAFFKEKWFLYYGTADSKIAVATLERSSN